MNGTFKRIGQSEDGTDSVSQLGRSDDLRDESGGSVVEDGPLKSLLFFFFECVQHGDVEYRKTMNAYAAAALRRH